MTIVPFLQAVASGGYNAQYTGGLAMLGAGIGIGQIGGRSAEAQARQPEIAGTISTNALILAALIEGVALFGVVVCLLIELKPYLG